MTDEEQQPQDAESGQSQSPAPPSIPSVTGYERPAAAPAPPRPAYEPPPGAPSSAYIPPSQRANPWMIATIVLGVLLFLLLCCFGALIAIGLSEDGGDVSRAPSVTRPPVVMSRGAVDVEAASSGGEIVCVHGLGDFPPS